MGARPFKITYRVGFQKVSRIVSCGSPEAVIRSCALCLISGRAEKAVVLLDDEAFAFMAVERNGTLQFKVL